MPEVLLATPEMATEYARWFVNRLAYTRQSDRPHPESGRHYYYRPRAEGGGELGLELEDVRRHLAGEITLGIYAINPETQRVKWMGIDADYKRSLDDLLKLQYELQQDGIQAALEQSRRGGHLWILFETPVLAKHARVYIRHLAGKLSVQVKASGPSDGIELFPKQDRIEPTQFGNAIRGPLGVHRAVNRRYWFYGAQHDLEAQMKYLRELTARHGEATLGTDRRPCARRRESPASTADRHALRPIALSDSRPLESGRVAARWAELGHAMPQLRGGGS